MTWSAIGLLIALIISTATGCGIVHAIWPVVLYARSWALRAALSVALGIGVHACIGLLWLILGADPVVLPVMDVVVMVGALTIWFVRWRRTLPEKMRDSTASSPPSESHCDAPSTNRFSIIAWLLHVSAALAVLVTGLAVYADAVHRPYGGWDAWCYWNTKARFFFRGGELWIRALTQATVVTQDYPLLLPLNLARLWDYIGLDVTLAGQVSSALFLATLIILLWGALAWLRSSVAASAAVLTLVATSTFVISAGSQYADGPLGLFILATCVLLIAIQKFQTGNQGLMLLAGATAGCAAWTKNEGLLFVVVTSATILVVDYWERVPHKFISRWRPWIAGLAPWLCCVIYQKTQLTGQSDIVNSKNAITFTSKLADVDRYRIILQWFFHVLVYILDPVIMALLLFWALLGLLLQLNLAGENSATHSRLNARRIGIGSMMLLPIFVLLMAGVWWWIGNPTQPNPSVTTKYDMLYSIYIDAGMACSALLGALICQSAFKRCVVNVHETLANSTQGRHENILLRRGIFILAGVITGYFAVFLVTPYDLTYQLGSAVDRLHMHVWPSMILLIFMYLPSPVVAREV